MYFYYPNILSHKNKLIFVKTIDPCYFQNLKYILNKRTTDDPLLFYILIIEAMERIFYLFIFLRGGGYIEY